MRDSSDVRQGGWVGVCSRMCFQLALFRRPELARWNLIAHQEGYFGAGHIFDCILNQSLVDEPCVISQLSILHVCTFVMLFLPPLVYRQYRSPYVPTSAAHFLIPNAMVQLVCSYERSMRPSNQNEPPHVS